MAQMSPAKLALVAGLLIGVLRPMGGLSSGFAPIGDEGGSPASTTGEPPWCRWEDGCETHYSGSPVPAADEPPLWLVDDLDPIKYPPHPFGPIEYPPRPCLDPAACEPFVRFGGGGSMNRPIQPVIDWHVPPTPSTLDG